MRKSLWLVLALLFAAVGAPPAHADSFTYTFVGNPAILGGTNFTLVDTAGPAPENVNLVSLLTSPSDLIVDGLSEGVLTGIFFVPSQVGLFAGGSGIGGTFTTPFDPSVAGSYNLVFGSAAVPAGTLTVIDNTLATPEPSSVALMLPGLGLLLLLLLRKRNSRGHQLAT